MLQCSKCNHRQPTGKFCGVCGSPMEQTDDEVITENEKDTETAQSKSDVEQGQQETEREQQTPVEEADTEVSAKNQVSTPKEDENMSKEQESTVAENTQERNEQESTVAENTQKKPGSSEASKESEVDNTTHEKEHVGAMTSAGQPTTNPTQTVAKEVSAASAPTTSTARPNENIAGTKTELSKFWDFYYKLLQNPSRALRLGENKFSYGLVNLILYVVMYALSTYFFVNSAYKELSFIGSDSLPFFEMFFQTAIGYLILVFVILLSTMGVLKIAQVRVSFKEFIVQYGGLLAPFIALFAVASLTGLSSSYKITIILITISVFFPLYVLPALLVFEKSSRVSQETQKVYLSILASLLAFVITYIVIKTVSENVFEEYFDVFDYFL